MNLDASHWLSTINEPWFHGCISPVIAETRLLKNGSFLVISSSPEEPGPTHSVCIKWNGICSKISIQCEPSESSSSGLLYSLGGTYKFPSVALLIAFYQENQLPISDRSEAVLFTPIEAPIFTKDDCDSNSKKRLQLSSTRAIYDLSRSLDNLSNTQQPSPILNSGNCNVALEVCFIIMCLYNQWTEIS